MPNYTSTTNNQLYEALFAFLNDTAYFPSLKGFMRADEEITPDSEQYGVVNIVSSKQRAIAEVTYKELPSLLLEEDIRGWFEKTVSIRVFRDNDSFDCVDILEAIVLYLKSSKVQQQLSLKGVGFVRSSRVRQTSVETKGTREKRAQVDLVFNVYKAITSDIEQIDTAEVEACTVVGAENPKPHYINTIKRSP